MVRAEAAMAVFRQIPRSSFISLLAELRLTPRKRRLPSSIRPSPDVHRPHLRRRTTDHYTRPTYLLLLLFLRLPEEATHPKRLRQTQTLPSLRRLIDAIPSLLPSSRRKRKIIIPDLKRASCREWPKWDKPFCLRRQAPPPRRRPTLLRPPSTKRKSTTLPCLGR